MYVMIMIIIMMKLKIVSTIIARMNYSCIITTIIEIIITYASFLAIVRTSLKPPLN